MLSIRDSTIVDELILDYLLYNCISALLYEWDVRHPEVDGSSVKVGSRLKEEASKNADRSLLLLHKNGARSLDREVRFRLILCRFVALFIRRIDPASSFSRKPQTSVTLSRKQQNSRLRLFFKRRGITHIFPNDDLLDHFVAASTGENELPSEHLIGYCIQRFGPDDGDDDDYTEKLWEEKKRKNDVDTGHIVRSSTIVPGVICGSATLSDALPLFMLLSAWKSVAAPDSPVNTQWMSIAASFMTHAFAEDYLCHGVSPLQAICENFAWGVIPLEDEDEDELLNSMEDMVINEMFGADGGEVSKEWEKIKVDLLTKIVPLKENLTLEKHLVDTLLTKPNPMNQESNDGDNCLGGSFDIFEKNIIGFVIRMVLEVRKPILTQLEQGQLDGVQDSDVEALLNMAGVSR